MNNRNDDMIKCYAEVALLDNSKSYTELIDSKLIHEFYDLSDLNIEYSKYCSPAWCKVSVIDEYQQNTLLNNWWQYFRDQDTFMPWMYDADDLLISIKMFLTIK